MYSVRFDGVSKRYPDADHDAVSELDLTIEAEEFVSLVGSSGCGKTTALRILAGLEEPTAGRVHLAGVEITRLDARDRHFGLITQQNQLAFNLTAGRNIQLPLEFRHSSGPLGREVVPDRKTPGRLEERVRAEAAQFGIVHLLDRRPRTLSEGQRRLVQLVRAVVASPLTLLLDEPLGYLDDQVRFALRREILRVHHERRLTTVMVTANQQDAMLMSDRIVVMLDGRVEQVGTPLELYDSPTSACVASFFGEPAMNLLTATVRIDGQDRYLELGERRLRTWAPVLDQYRDALIVIGVRPEDIEVGVPQTEGFAATVASVETRGHVTSIVTHTDMGQPIMFTVPRVPPRVGTVVDLGFRGDRLHLFDALSGAALHHPIAR